MIQPPYSQAVTKLNENEGKQAISIFIIYDKSFIFYEYIRTNKQVLETIESMYMIMNIWSIKKLISM